MGNPVVVSVVCLIVGMFSIQSGASLAKQLFPLLGPVGTTTVRITFAAIILSAIWRPWRKQLSRQDLFIILMYGASLTVMNVFFYLSLTRIPLGVAVAVEYTGPLAIALCASRRPVDFLWALLAALGILLVLPSGDASHSFDPTGVIFALIGGVGWAFYILFGQRAGNALHGGTATAFGMIAASLVILPFGLWDQGPNLVSLESLPTILAVAVLSSALPYSLEMIALRNLPAKTFGILMSLEPAVGALSGLLFLNQHLTSIQCLAIACVMTASFGSVLRRDKAIDLCTPEALG